MRCVRTLNADVPPEDLGFTLVHEHIFASFGEASGDTDLEFVHEAEILRDLREARTCGVTTIVEVSAEDMGASFERTYELAARTSLSVVKSVGWFRSPTADPLLTDASVERMAQDLVELLTSPVDQAPLRAGVLGEVGCSATKPTETESRILDATAAAALETGAGIVLHTDDVENGEALVTNFLEREVPAGRLMVGHARANDPLSWQREIISSGAFLAFDQLGHQKRDPIEAVAKRILDLIRDTTPRIGLSADVGRRSRLRAHGGSGYVAPLIKLLRLLGDHGVPHAALDHLSGGSAAAFLAMPTP
jgi:predicted metal-dependent phosphotriesterase family hydrolase